MPSMVLINLHNREGDNYYHQNEYLKDNKRGVLHVLSRDPGGSKMDNQFSPSPSYLKLMKPCYV